MEELNPRKEFTIPTTLNGMIIVVQVASFFLIFAAAAQFQKPWHVICLAMAFAVLGNSIYSIIHEAEHAMLHPNRKVNDGLGMLMALFFPAPFHLIRQGHLGHHRRNRTDEEAFDHYFDGDRPWLKYFILYGIITGLYWLLVVFSNLAVLFLPFLFQKKFFEFDRPSAVFMESLNPRWFWLIQLEGLAAMAFHVAVIWGLQIPLLNYALVYFGFGFSWSAMQYVHHFGTERDVLNGARNLRFFGWIDNLWLHHNWHLSHHRHPNVPWIHLPKLADSDGTTRESLVWHYLRMWRGPRYTVTRFPLRQASNAPSHSGNGDV